MKTTRSACVVFLASMVATIALLVTTASAVFADFNEDKCNRGAFCINWIPQPWPAQALCGDGMGGTTFPTDAGCSGSNCGPCRTVICTNPNNSQVGAACDCKLTMPLTQSPLCQTCMKYDGFGYVLWMICKDNGCAPAHDCDIAVTAGAGTAKCSCHD